VDSSTTANSVMMCNYGCDGVRIPMLLKCDIFPHPNPSDVHGEFLFEFEFGYLLITCLRGEHPLSAEAVRKFGPMHIPIASKGYENLFVALANRKR